MSTATTSSTAPIEGMSLTQKEKEDEKKNTACFCCGEKGHHSPQCPKLDETKHKDWKIKSDNDKGVTWGTGASGFQTGMQWLQIHNDQEEMCLHQSTKRTEKIKQPRETDFNNNLVLDTSAAFSSVKNKDLLAGVCEVNRPIKMCMNTGTQFVTERGEILGVKTDPWLDEKSMANIVSFAELK